MPRQQSQYDVSSTLQTSQQSPYQPKNYLPWKGDEVNALISWMEQNVDRVLTGKDLHQCIKNEIFEDNDRIDALKIKNKIHNMRRGYAHTTQKSQNKGFGLNESDPEDTVEDKLNRMCNHYTRLHSIWGPKPIVTKDLNIPLPPGVLPVPAKLPTLAPAPAPASARTITNPPPPPHLPPMLPAPAVPPNPVPAAAAMGNNPPSPEDESDHDIDIGSEDDGGSGSGNSPLRTQRQRRAGGIRARYLSEEWEDSKTRIQIAELDMKARIRVAELDMQARIRVAEIEKEARIRVAEIDRQSKVTEGGE